MFFRLLNSTFAFKFNSKQYMKDNCKAFLAKPFFHDYRTLLGLWLLLPIIGAIMKLHSCNNFLIFKYVFWHAWNGTSLYAFYPEEFSDLFEGPAEESEYHYIELIRESRDIESLIPLFLSMCLSEKKIREAKSILSTVGEPIIDGDVMYSKSDSSEDDYIMLRKYHLDNRVIRIY